MKKVMFMIATLLMLSTTDVSAQGFLKKLKQKAEAAVNSIAGVNEDEQVSEDADKSMPDDPSNITLAQGSDIVPKRKTSTITWDGTITPSTASTAAALMKELPALPHVARWKSVMPTRRRSLP